MSMWSYISSSNTMIITPDGELNNVEPNFRYIDTLPVHPHPGKLESQSGYLTRLGDMNAVTTLGQLRIYYDHRLPGDHLAIELAPSSLSAFAVATNHSERVLRATTVYHLAATFDIRIRRNRPRRSSVA